MQPVAQATQILLATLYPDLHDEQATVEQLIAFDPQLAHELLTKLYPDAQAEQAVAEADVQDVQFAAHAVQADELTK